jgi:hypothetical protein
MRALLLCLCYLPFCCNLSAEVREGLRAGNVSLIVQWFQTPFRFRNKELSDSICTNLKLDHLKHIYFLQREDITLDELVKQVNCKGIPADEIKRKAKIFKLEHKSIPVLKFDNSASFYLDHNHHTDTLSFEEAFAFANRHLPNQLVMVANLDISFDETARELAELSYFPSDLTLFLSRYERPANEPFGIGTQCGPQYIASHDVFVFKTPLPPQLIESCRGIPLGILGAENMAMWNFKSAGYTVDNPCDRIKTWHNHRSGKRKPVTYKLNNPIKSGVCYPPSHLYFTK